MEETVSGYVEKIKFRNEENGYTVFELSNEGEDVTCVGNLTFLNEGEYIQVTGIRLDHKVYGEQIKVTGYVVKEPEDALAMERYLGSGAIKGVGPKLAARITSRFQGETFLVLEEHPERLAEITGISKKMALAFGRQFEEKREMRNAMLFLQKYGVSNNLAVKIYKAYGARMYEVLKENPYRLAEDVTGIGFRIADEIGRKVGVEPYSSFRIRAGVLFALTQAEGMGHVYLPESTLVSRAAELLEISVEDVARELAELSLDKHIMRKELDGEAIYYGATLYYMELNVARMLLDLNIRIPYREDEVEKKLVRLEATEGVQLDEMQRLAVVEAAKNGFLVITGGPGTGKTTTINAIIHFLEMEGMDVLLAAPTGRAAKRMTEATGHEAQTIHRLLELSGGLDSEEKGMRFERDESHPLEADAVIIDETSMVDIRLMHALLRAVPVGTRLILVGDVNQLPSVGPGNVLRDVIASHCFNLVMLVKIFRQAAESDIIVNAHRINAGEAIEMDNASKDFFMLEKADAKSIQHMLIHLINERLSKYLKVTPYDVQVLTPMRKGELGVERLNEVLQQYLNPPTEGKRELAYLQTIFREGDKVMQIKNNYHVKWERKESVDHVVLEEGEGAFNGDLGVVKRVNEFSNEITVLFDDKRYITYPYASLEELELAYAVTIHKSQGSEYPAVILPLLSGPRMLLNRNLLYTAVTRAKTCVTIIGRRAAVYEMIANETEQKRFSTLDWRIKEMRGD